MSLLINQSPLSQPVFELFKSAEIPPTHGFTQNAKSKSSRRLTFCESIAWIFLSRPDYESSL